MALLGFSRQETVPASTKGTSDSDPSCKLLHFSEIFSSEDDAAAITIIQHRFQFCIIHYHRRTTHSYNLRQFGTIKNYARYAVLRLVFCEYSIGQFSIYLHPMNSPRLRRMLARTTPTRIPAPPAWPPASARSPAHGSAGSSPWVDSV